MLLYLVEWPPLIRIICCSGTACQDVLFAFFQDQFRSDLGTLRAGVVYDANNKVISQRSKQQAVIGHFPCV